MSASNFTLLGYGHFGQAFADLLQRAGYQLRVFDPKAAVPPALSTSDARTAVEGADWIVLAMPIREPRSALQPLVPHLHAEQIVFDVGSVKLHPCAAMDEMLGGKIPHAGTHPLFGPLSLARGDRLLRVVACPAPNHPQAAERVARLYDTLGCEVVTEDPANHDRAMARTHAMAYFVAKGMIEFGMDDSMALAPPSFEGIRRMLDAVRGDAGHLFAAIQRENPFAAEARKQLLAALKRVHAELLTQADDDSMAIATAPV